MKNKFKYICLALLFFAVVSYTFAQTATISGNVATISGNALNEVMVSTDGGTYAAITDENGDYSLELPTGANYTISFDRVNTSLTEGVSFIDMAKIQMHILGMQVFDQPFQYIAADANLSLTIAALDLVHFRQALLGEITSFPNDNKSWQFIDASYVLPDIPFTEELPRTLNINNLSSDMSGQDFIGIKTGNVDCH